MKTALPILALLILLLPSSGAAQLTLGTEFYLTDTINLGASDTTEFGIVIANPDPTVTVSCTIVNTVHGTTVQAVPPEDTSVVLFPGIQRDVASPPDRLQSFDPVYHITCDGDVGVYDFNTWDMISTNDSSVILPVHALGTDYVVGSYLEDTYSNGLDSWLAVVATQPGTTSVDLYDRARVWIPPTVTLAQGEYFLLNNNGSRSSPHHDLTGWRIEANQDVGAFSGTLCTAIGARNACDHIHDMLLPEPVIADTYVVCPTAIRPVEAGGEPCATLPCQPDLFRFVSNVTTTDLSLTPAVCTLTSHVVSEGRFTLLPEGHFAECYADTPFIITATAGGPFWGYQYLVSSEATYPGHPPGGEAGDPAIVDILPVDEYRRNYILHAPEPASWDHHFMTVAIPTDAISSFRLDDAAPALNCTVAGTVGTTQYSCCKVDISPGPHIAEADSSFGLLLSGTGWYGSYLHLGAGGEVEDPYCEAGGPYAVTCPEESVVLTPTTNVTECPDRSSPTYTWVSTPPGAVTFDPPGVLNPTATIHDCGVFDICLEIRCNGNLVTSCCTTMETTDVTAPQMTPGSIDDCYDTCELAKADAIAQTTITDECDYTVSAECIFDQPDPCDVRIVVTATDACGLSSSVEYLTRIDDDTPVMTPGTFEDCYDTCEAAKADALARTTISDDCDYTASAECIFDQPDPCDVRIVVTASDQCGHSNSVEYYTRIDDDTPVMTPGTLDDCYDTCELAKADAIAQTTITDDCDYTASAECFFDQPDPCDVRIVVTATDQCGHSNSVEYLTHIDPAPPEMTPGTLEGCYDTCEAAKADALARTTITDECDYTASAECIFDQPDPCDVRIVVTATDQCGHSNSVEYLTRIDDDTPVMTPGTIEDCYDTCEEAKAAALAQTTITDDCDYTASAECIFDQPDPCDVRIVVTATDQCGHSNSVEYFTRIDDDTPEMTPGTLEDCYDTCELAKADAIAQTTITDDCDYTASAECIFDQPDPCDVRIVVTATDQCGHSNSVEYLTRIDDDTPVMTPGVIEDCYDTCEDAKADAIAQTTITDDCDYTASAECIFDQPDPCDVRIVVTATDQCGHSNSVEYLTRIDPAPPEMTPGTLEDCYDTCEAAKADALARTIITDECDYTASAECIFDQPDPCDVRIVVTATDQCGNSNSVQYLTRIDDDTPVVSPPEDLDGACLWPPNHKYVCFEDFSLGWTIEDECDWSVPSIICESDQAPDAPDPDYPGQNGDGHTLDDCVYDPATDTLCVRSERAGTNPEGRTYTVTLTAEDQCLHQGEGTMTIHVPHDQSPHRDCIRPKPGPSCCPI